MTGDINQEAAEVLKCSRKLYVIMILEVTYVIIPSYVLQTVRYSSDMPYVVTDHQQTPAISRTIPVPIMVTMAQKMHFYLYIFFFAFFFQKKNNY